MRLASLTAIVALATATPACTLVTVGLTTSVISTHNEIADSSSHWNYGTPLLVSALIGLVADIGILLVMSKQWSQPMT